MKTYTLTQIQEACRKLGYSFFEKGDYNLNIIGIRNLSTNKIDNLFDDTLFLAYKVEGRFNTLQFPMTTQPGAYYMQNLMNKLGAAILVPGQYRSYELGLHQGKYEALVQRGLLKTYRDKDRDSIYDYDTSTIVDSQGDGINIHHAGRSSKKIDNWSAGCQVLANMDEWDIFINLCKRSAQLYGNRFTYTLLTSEQI